MAVPIPPAQIEYFEEHASDNVQISLIVIPVVCLVVAYTAVFLRFIARWKNRASFQTDDWLILLSLVRDFVARVWLRFWLNFTDDLAASTDRNGHYHRPRRSLWRR